MNGFDIIILVILLIAFISGFRKGLIRMLIGLATIILAAVFGGRLATYLLPYISKIGEMSPQWANLLAYVAAFIIIGSVLSLIGRLIHKLFTLVNLSFANKLLGGVIAIGSVMVILSILLNLLLIIDPKTDLIKPEIQEDSFFYERIQSVIPAVVPYLNIDDLREILPEEFIKQNEIPDSHHNINGEGNVIDGDYQKEYFSTDSL